MFLKQHHLTYCTNIHRGSTWSETMAALENHTLEVKRQICPNKSFGIGLWLSDQSSRELAEPAKLTAFKAWLTLHDCYIFTMNGFPFGQFHGTQIKEKVFLPDWTDEARLVYTKRLFDLLGELLPPGVNGTISTLPGSFKEFITNPEQVEKIYANLWDCIDYIQQCEKRFDRKLQLAIEPEPFGLWETSKEVVACFRAMKKVRPKDTRLKKYLTVNYDTCHMAIQYEECIDVVKRFKREGISIGKIHLSAALSVLPNISSIGWLLDFEDETYLHQVIAQGWDMTLRRYKDLNLALGENALKEREWRIHFHVPLNVIPRLRYAETTISHVKDILGLLEEYNLCNHLEIETYTWEVLPREFRCDKVEVQLARELEWVLAMLSFHCLL